MKRIEVARIVVVTKTRPYRFLLVQRHDPDGFGHLQWEIPGGKVEPTENPVEAGVRELREETGLGVHADDITNLGFLYGNEVYQSAVMFTVVPSVVPVHIPDPYRWIPTSKIPVVGCGWFTFAECQAMGPVNMLVGNTLTALRSVFDHLVTT